MLDKLKTLVGIPSKDANSIFDSSTAISAKAAYMNTKYGRTRTREQLLRDFFKDTNDRIKTKTINNEYCCMVEVDEDIKCFLPIILDRYGKELGYNIAVITDGTKIQQPGEQPVELTPASTFVILMWNNADITDKDDEVSRVIDSVSDTDESSEEVAE